MLSHPTQAQQTQSKAIFLESPGGQEGWPCCAGSSSVTAMVWKEPKFPTEDHPDWNPEEPYKDPVALLEHRELQVRQKFVRMEKAKARRCTTACISHHCMVVPPETALLGDGALLHGVKAHIAAWLAHSCSTLCPPVPHAATQRCSHLIYRCLHALYTGVWHVLLHGWQVFAHSPGCSAAVASVYEAA